MDSAFALATRQVNHSHSWSRPPPVASQPSLLLISSALELQAHQVGEPLGTIGRISWPQNPGTLRFVPDSWLGLSSEGQQLWRIGVELTSWNLLGNIVKDNELGVHSMDNMAMSDSEPKKISLLILKQTRDNKENCWEQRHKCLARSVQIRVQVVRMFAQGGAPQL